MTDFRKMIEIYNMKTNVYVITKISLLNLFVGLRQFLTAKVGYLGGFGPHLFTTSGIQVKM